MPGLQTCLGCEAECHCLGRRHRGPATSLTSTSPGEVGGWCGGDVVRRKDKAPSLKLPPAAAVGVTLQDLEGTTRSARYGGQGCPAMPELEGGGQGTTSPSPPPPSVLRKPPKSQVQDSKCSVPLIKKPTSSLLPGMVIPLLVSSATCG